MPNHALITLADALRQRRCQRGTRWRRLGSGRDRACCSGKHQTHGVNVQVLADPNGRLIWASPALPGARHDLGAARELGIIDALQTASVRVIADNGYRGAGFAFPQCRRSADPEIGQRHRLTQPEGDERNQKAVNSAHARQRGPVGSVW